MGTTFSNMGRGAGSVRLPQMHDSAAIAKYREALTVARSSPAHDSGGDAQYPEYFTCPITGELMLDPVIDKDGHSYERSAIEQWLQRSERSPMTRSRLALTDLSPNRALKAGIEAFKVGEGISPKCSKRSLIDEARTWVERNDTESNNSVEYRAAHLAALNEQFTDWLEKHLKKSPSGDFTQHCNAYVSHAKDISSGKYDDAPKPASTHPQPPSNQRGPETGFRRRLIADTNADATLAQTLQQEELQAQQLRNKLEAIDVEEVLGELSSEQAEAKRQQAREEHATGVISTDSNISDWDNSDNAEASVVPTGTYRVSHVATATTGLSRHTSIVTDCYGTIEKLRVGAYVDVVETRYVAAEKRVRGRIRAGVGLAARWSSDGWISIINTDTGFAWADLRTGKCSWDW